MVMIAWSSTYPTRLKSIFMIQKKVVRMMTFSSYRKETKAVFTSLKIMNIYELVALFTYFHMVFFSQTSMNIFFQKIKPNTITTCARSASKVHFNYQRTDYGKFSVNHWGAEIWNNLPDNLKNKYLTILLNI